MASESNDSDVSNASSKEQPAANGKILIVTPGLSSTNVLESTLVQNAFSVRSTETLEHANQLVANWNPDALIMGFSPTQLTTLGFTAALRCNPRFNHICVVFAIPEEFNSDMNQLECLSSGADALVSLPLCLPLIVARLRAAMRLGRKSDPDADPIAVGPVRIDHKARRAWAGDKELVLTPREYGILYRLVGSPGEVCDSMDLLSCSGSGSKLSSKRTLDVHVSSLRRKMGHYGSMIDTVRGGGYRMVVLDP